MRIQVRERGRGIGFVIVGTLILAFGTALFLLPYDLVAGGVSGIAVILHRCIPQLPKERSIAVLTWGLFVFGWCILGTRFAWRTFLSGIFYPIGIVLFSHLTSRVEGSASTAEQLCAAVVGGILVGIGCALTVLGGGSTGGTDVLAFIGCKLFPRMRHAIAMLLIDVTVIAVGVVALRQPMRSLLGIVSATVSAVSIDCVLRIGRAT